MGLQPSGTVLVGSLGEEGMSEHTICGEQPVLFQCLGFVSCRCDKLTQQEQLQGEKVCFARSSRFQSTVAGRQQCQDLEGAGHTASPLKEQSATNTCLLVLRSLSP